MKINLIKIAVSLVVALSPLLYYEFRELLPAFDRRPLVYEILFFIPYLFFVLTAILGLKLNQSRIFFSAVLWAVLYYLINASTLTGFDFEFNEVQLVKLLALSSFLVLISLYAIKEKYIMGVFGLLRLLIVAIPIAVCVWLANKITPGSYPYLMEQGLFNWESWRLPDLALLFTGGLVLFLFVQKDKSILHFKHAIYVNVIPLLLTLNFAAGREKPDVELHIFSAFSFAVMGTVFLYALYRMYWEKVYIDELTSVPNRRAFDEYLKKLGRKYVIAMVDVDHFKKFNDTYGHSEGDNVLRFVAKHIADEAGGAVFRYGGEEFSVIYRGVQIKEAFNRLDLMRANLAESSFFLRSSEDVRKTKTKKNRRKTVTRAKEVKVTISIGVSHKTAAKKEALDVIDTADKALYKAKKNGRNRCEKILA